MESTLAVANYFIEKGLKSKSPEVSPMKLQKFVYFSHGWYWAFKNEPLINESVEAWKFGLVIPSIYHEFGRYGNDKITRLSVRSGKAPRVENKEALELLGLIWDVYSGLSPIHLSNLTHQDGTPWHDTVMSFHNQGRELPRGKDIDDDLIRKFFTHQLAQV